MDCLGSILLVDDEEAFREMINRRLTRQGFECCCASDADEAIQALKNRRFDVMISDIRMAANEDLRVVQEAHARDSRMSVILVTGYPSAETAIRSIQLSVSAYLTKPLEFDELLKHINIAVSRSLDRRAMAAIRDRLQTCMKDLEQVEQQFNRAGMMDAMIPAGTIQTLAACLSELLRLSGRSGPEQQSLCRLLDCPQQPVHRQAIAETIEVLKKTKDSFKSKALAELRFKLESLSEP
jgi:DNA-binding NtrC family response regulator